MCGIRHSLGEILGAAREKFPIARLFSADALGSVVKIHRVILDEHEKLVGQGGVVQKLPPTPEKDLLRRK